MIISYKNGIIGVKFFYVMALLGDVRLIWNGVYKRIFKINFEVLKKWLLGL